jgi:hypothetical protein
MGYQLRCDVPNCGTEEAAFQNSYGLTNDLPVGWSRIERAVNLTEKDFTALSEKFKTTIDEVRASMRIRPEFRVYDRYIVCSKHPMPDPPPRAYNEDSFGALVRRAQPIPVEVMAPK